MADISSSVFRSGSYANKAQVTASGGWTVPTGVSKIKILCTGGGGGGGGSLTGDGPQPGSGGGASGTGISELLVTAGQVLNIVIGAGGTAVSGSNGNSGGASYVRIGSSVVAYSPGGVAGVKNSTTNTSARGAHSLGAESYAGGGGGGGGVTNATAQGGFYAFVRTVYNAALDAITGLNASNGGTGGTVTGGGGGGGCSIYGSGGSGGNGVNSNIIGLAGSAPPAGSYGAGGGGAGGSNGSGGQIGGNGLSGIVEILY